MIINIGSEFLGEIDRIRGFGSIKTKFMTIMHFPIFPEDSYFIVHGSAKADDDIFLGVGWISSESVKAVKLSLNFKSVILAYLQRIVLFFILIWGFMCFINILNDYETIKRDVIIEIAAIIVLILSKVFNKASISRRNEIIQQLNNSRYNESDEEPEQREEPVTSLDEIEEAMQSDDETDRSWAINEINSLPPDIAAKLLEKYGLDQ